ncbi:MAG: response regulator [Myxococcales bacterium FL481]|nr:MAG: response regulator [Myxococcales bacterium FL481]
MSLLRVLVIDDDPSICEYLDKLLTREDCDVTTCCQPREGLQLIENDDYHIVILDLQMPDRPGMDLLSDIRRQDQNVAVIILTGFPTLESATNAISLDISAYMQKPFSGEEMRDTIAAVARKKGIMVRPEDELHISIGRQIRKHRKDRSMPLRVLSQRVHMSISLLSQIERAERPASISHLYRIANALEMRVVDLIGDF